MHRAVRLKGNYGDFTTQSRHAHTTSYNDRKAGARENEPSICDDLQLVRTDRMT